MTVNATDGVHASMIGFHGDTGTRFSALTASTFCK